MARVNSLPSFTIKGITFPLAKGTGVNSKILEAILYSYAPYYSGTGPNGTDPQVYAGSGNGLQPPWGNAWADRNNIGKIVSALMQRLYLAKNEWDVEREARFAVNNFMRQLTGRNSALNGATAARLGDSQYVASLATNLYRNTAANAAPPTLAAIAQASAARPAARASAARPVARGTVNSFLKSTTKTTGVIKQASPGKSTPNKNPAVPALPKPTPVSGCVPGYHIYNQPLPTYSNNGGVTRYDIHFVPTCVPDSK